MVFLRSLDKGIWACLGDLPPYMPRRAETIPLIPIFVLLKRSNDIIIRLINTHALNFYHTDNMFISTRVLIIYFDKYSNYDEIHRID